MSRYSSARTRGARLAAIALLTLGVSAAAGPIRAQDQDQPAANAPAPGDTAKPPPADAQKKRHHAKRPAEATPPAPTSPANPPAAAAAAAPPDPVVQQLAKAGVKTCLSTMSDLGKQTMAGVTGYARAANWQSKTPDERIATVLMAQSYPDNAPLPKAFAMLFGTPAGKTKCDGYAIQVIPTVEKCSALQTKITIRGKKLGDLAGVPLLTDVNGAQVLLLPGANDSCVLVGVRINYAD